MNDMKEPAFQVIAIMGKQRLFRERGQEKDPLPKSRKKAAIGRQEDRE